MIGLIIIVIVVILLFNSFSKFNSWTRRHEGNLKTAIENLKFEPNNVEHRYTKGVSLMQLQNYPEAIREFEFIIHNAEGVYYQPIIQSSRDNIEFCNKPLSWSSSYPVDKSGSYWHYIVLDYFGNRRNVLSKTYK